jgi:hypothetical protein
VRLDCCRWKERGTYPLNLENSLRGSFEEAKVHPSAWKREPRGEWLFRGENFQLEETIFSSLFIITIEYLTDIIPGTINIPPSLAQ